MATKVYRVFDIQWRDCDTGDVTKQSESMPTESVMVFTGSITDSPNPTKVGTWLADNFAGNFNVYAGAWRLSQFVDIMMVDATDE